MSGVFKAVGKVFKPIVKAAKVIVPVVLAAAAIYFTAGSALGVAGTAGGWGAAVSSAVGGVLGTGTIAGVVTGAVTYAGYGAIAGGVLAGVTGKNVIKGMGKGALVGAVAGGAMGAMGMTPATAPGVVGGEGAAAGTSTVGSGSGAITSQPLPAAGGGAPISSPVVDPGFTQGGVGGLVQPAAAPVSTGASSLTATGTQAAAPSGMMKFMDTAAGAGLVAGVGQGLLSSGEADATLEAEREERADRRANYGGAGPGLYTGAERPTLRQQASRMSADPLDPGGAEGSYQYDPRMGRVVWVQ